MDDVEQLAPGQTCTLNRCALSCVPLLACCIQREEDGDGVALHAQSAGVTSTASNTCQAAAKP